MSARGGRRGFVRTLTGLVAAALSLGVAAGASAEPAPPALVLTLEDVRRLALERGREIRRAEQYGAGVRGRYLEERAAALPQVELQAGYARQQDGSVPNGDGRTDLTSVLAGVTQPLFTWGRIPAAIRAAKVGLATAGDRLRQARQLSVRDAVLAWYDALLAVELHELALRNLAQKERLLGESRKKLEAGTATDYDVLAAEVSLANARPEVLRAENLARAARERLRFLLALEEATGLELRGTLEVVSGALPAYAEELERARRNRPDLAELRNQRSIADEVITITRAGTKPRVDARASAGWQSLAVDGDPEAGALWSAGVFLTWPLYDGRRVEGQVLRAASDAAGLATAEGELLDAIALETRGAVDAVQVSSGIMGALEGTVSQAERLLAMAEKGYELGVKTRLDVDDAQLNLSQARGNLARARRDYLAALTTLAWVTGTLVE